MEHAAQMEGQVNIYQRIFLGVSAIGIVMLQLSLFDRWGFDRAENHYWQLTILIAIGLGYAALSSHRSTEE
jgi:hypothetical protein